MNQPTNQQYLGIDNIEPGVDIAIDDFEIKRLASDYFPTENVCSDLVRNGQAEMDPFSPYPFISSSSSTALTVKQEEGGNSYFRLAGRSQTYHTIRYPITTECLTMEMVVEASLKSRATKAVDMYSRLLFVTKDSDGSDKWDQIKIADCMTGVNEWQDCVGRAGITKPQVFDAHRLYLDVAFRTDTTTPIDFDDISLTLQSGPAGGFLVKSEGVNGCWKAGSKVLISSDTIYFEDDTVVTLKTVQPTADNMVALTFEETLSPRSSKEDMFAVELALMERNIKFTSNSYELGQGGHFAVWQTPQAQVLDGVEFYKFGQQGTLGRYPIHWHMCGNVQAGSIAKRNLVVDSNQRGVVIHGTHNMTIQENVVYEHFGHGYLLEDGGEIDNSFIRNFGGRTKNMDINPPLRGGIDDDRKSSTFWCTNPMNTWIGNVAAGGEDTGFWFDLDHEVKSPSVAIVEGSMMELPLTKFQDNIAHSYRRKGLKTYEDGYRPIVRARFENTWSYKNQLDGIFFHNSWNLGVYGGVFADNRYQIRIDRADNVDVENVLIIGQTESHDKALERVAKSGNCPSDRHSLYGISIHSFLFSNRSPRGPTLKNVEFRSISDSESQCTNTAAIWVHDHEIEPSFESWTKFDGLTFDSTVETKFSMCDAIAKGVKDVVIEVAGSTMYGDPGFLVSDGQPELLAFVDQSQCSLDQDACLQFCRNTCFEVVRFLVEPTPQTENMVLVIQDDQTGASATYTSQGLTSSDAKRHDTYRPYSVAVPVGSYTAKFIKDGVEIWPTFVKQQYASTPDCVQGDGSTFTMSKPTPSDGFCNTLIGPNNRNGNLENGSLDYWNHVHGSIELAEFIPSTVVSDSFAVATQRTNQLRVGQYLDTRCMLPGDKYEVFARIRYVDGSGNTISCNPASDGGDRCSYATLYSEKVDPITAEREYDYDRAAYVIDSLYDDEWQVLHGVFKVSDFMAVADSVLLYIEHGKGITQVDNLLVKKVDYTNNPVILNGDFETGDYRYWSTRTSTMLSPGFGGSSAAIMNAVDKGFSQYLHNKNRLVQGDRYLFSAKYKLDDDTMTCDPSVWSGDDACPRFVMYSTVADNSLPAEWVGQQITAAPFLPGQWNTLWTYVTITEMQSIADSVRLEISKGPKGSRVIVDNISLTPQPSMCANLVVNGGAEEGDSRGWKKWREGLIGISQQGSDGAGLVVTGRGQSWHGLEQILDTNCMVLGAKYSITGKMRMVDSNTGLPHTCTVGNAWGDSACPVVGIQGRTQGQDSYYLNAYSTLTADWVADQYNDYASEFEITQELVDAEKVSLYIERPPGGIDIYVDELKVVKL